MSAKPNGEPPRREVGVIRGGALMHIVMLAWAIGNTWFQPSYGANGVSYRVVPTP